MANYPGLTLMGNLIFYSSLVHPEIPDSKCLRYNFPAIGGTGRRQVRMIAFLHHSGRHVISFEDSRRSILTFYDYYVNTQRDSVQVREQRRYNLT